jgi:hypothetical protein
MPSTVRVRVRRSSVGLLRRTNPARRSLAHAAHTFSTSCGEVPSRALQAPECSHLRSLAIRGTSAFVTDGIDSFESLVPGTDDPSAPFGSTVVARLRELIAPLVPTPDAAPLRLLRPRARGQGLRSLQISASRLRLDGRRISLPTALRGYPRSTIAPEAWRRSLRRPKPPRTRFSVLNDPPDLPGRSTYGLERQHCR